MRPFRFGGTSLLALAVGLASGWVVATTAPLRASAADRNGASVAVPETLESSLQLSEAALTELGVAMGPVIASIHEMRDEMRERIMRDGGLDEKPRLRSLSGQMEA